jgi:hypothetical protein
MKISVFWDTITYNQVKVNRRFEGTYSLHRYIPENITLKILIRGVRLRNKNSNGTARLSAFYNFN